MGRGDHRLSRCRSLALARTDGRKEFFRRWVGPFDEWGVEIVEAIDVGDSVLAHVHQWGRGKGSGATVEDSHWQVWTVRDGKVVRVTLRVDRDEALEAVGLRDRASSEED